MSEKECKTSIGNEKSKVSTKGSSENGLTDTENTKRLQSTVPSEPETEKDVNTERSSRRSKKARSRSKTPQKKNGLDKTETDTKLEKPTLADVMEKDEINKIEINCADTTEENGTEQNTEENKVDTIDSETEDVDDTKSSQGVKSSEDLNTTEELILDSESYMDPLVLQSDEPCPELEFEENSDKESGKYSPIITRCMTRRSQNRNIPTPKTPKSLFDEQESEKGITPTPTPDPEEVPKNTPLMDFNETDDSSNTDNLSTKVQVGGDATRINFSEGESDFLSNLKNRDDFSFPLCISSRRSIKPLSDDIRKKSLKNSMHKANLSIPFFSRDSIERAPSVKRKSRSETPEGGKRIKEDSPGFMAKITSPLSSLRSKFTAIPNSTSTPKLTSYQDQKNHFGGDFFDQMEVPGPEVDPQSKWCSIM
ncbi:hypothetical protein HHI36_008676 [Cryptolaemus montrouzieri]|uniref:Uncharacterized protein n=1 Tax=Cryptolaemus montrouzieri TaxID=559131 RepID=A0ABD2MTH0_9CUCU